MKSPCIIWDWNRTLFNPETRQLYPDAVATVTGLCQVGITQVLVSQFEASGVDDVVRLVPSGLFSELSVIPKKSFWTFLSLAWKYRKFDRFVIGDRVRSEIVLGNLTGFRTIWIKQGKFEQQHPRHLFERPNLVVNSLQTILPLFLTAGCICAEQPDVGNNPQNNPEGTP